MKIIRTAWRNMWRNRTRTIITASAVGISALVVSMVIAFQSGFINDMKTNVRNDVTGDVRIMNETYVKNERIMPLQFCLQDTERMIALVESSPLVKAATPRTEIGVAVYRKGKETACRACGVDFATSHIFSNPAVKLVAGTFPASGLKGSAGVVITAGMAKELSLSPGDKFTAITRTATNGTNGKTFTVAGIILLPDTDYANRVFFLDWLVAGEYLRMGRNALQLQVFLKNPDAAEAAAGSIAKLLDSGYRVQSWTSVKGIYQFLAMAGYMYAIMAGIFYILASTVIFNTTMMSVLERKKEIGTLAALGMDQRGIILLFLAESMFISSLGSAAGLLAGAAIITIAGRAGFDVSLMGGNSISGMGFSQIIYPSLTCEYYLFIFTLGFTISLAASALPARFASKIEPAQALANR